MLPNFMDVFTWSIPFVSEKVTEMFQSMLRKAHILASDEPDVKAVDIQRKLEEEMDQSKDKHPPALERSLSKRQIIKKRLLFVTRMVRFFRLLREENETIVKLKGMSPDNRIPRGLLLEGKDAIKDAYEAFSKAKKADIINERRPMAPNS